MASWKKRLLMIVTFSALGIAVFALIIGITTRGDSSENGVSETEEMALTGEEAEKPVYRPEPFDTLHYLGMPKDQLKQELRTIGLTPKPPPSGDDGIVIADVDKVPFDYFWFGYIIYDSKCTSIDIYFDSAHDDDDMWKERLKWCGLTSLQNVTPEVDEFNDRRWRTNLPEGVNLVVDLGSTVSVYAIY